MLELLNIRFPYLLRASRKKAEGLSPVVLRVTFRNERRDLFTGLYCLDTDWDSSRGTFTGSSKPALAFNKNLELIVHKAHEVFQELKYSGNDFTIEDLICKMRGKEKNPSLLIEYIEEANQKIKLRPGIDISPATFQKYRRRLRHLQEFWAKNAK